MNKLGDALDFSLCRAMDSETTPIVPKKAPPMFSEPAQIQTVDTVEGLICTHEVRAILCTEIFLLAKA